PRTYDQLMMLDGVARGRTGGYFLFDFQHPNSMRNLHGVANRQGLFVQAFTWDSENERSIGRVLFENAVEVHIRRPISREEVLGAIEDAGFLIIEDWSGAHFEYFTCRKPVRRRGE
ncbi:MAG: hypothetical protein AAFQ82_18190, partial [Myxococcota bacterium]